MSNHYAIACTNYVRVKDLSGLKSSIEAFAVRLIRKSEAEDMWALVSECESGWPSIYPDPDNPHADAEYLDFRKDVFPYLCDGEVLVAVFIDTEMSQEKSRYGVGLAKVMTVKYGQWCAHTTGLDYIYSEAAKRFGVDIESITAAMGAVLLSRVGQ